MKALASFILRGFSQAMLVTVTGAVLAFIFPLFSLISGAAVALVTLRKGSYAGLMVIVASTVFVGALAYFSLGSLVPALTLLGILWLPLWAVAWVLREFRSLALAMIVSGGMGILGVIAIYLLIGDVTAWWHQELLVIFEPAIKAGGQLADRASVVEILGKIAGLMTGIVAAGMVLNTVICLFLARGWQAQLFNPGGFRDEFYQLQLGKTAALVSLSLMALSLLPLGEVAHAAGEMMIVVLSLYAVQGLALAHAIVAKRKMHVAWLVALYVVPFLLLPQLIAAIAIFGLIDSWVNFRSRVAEKST